MAEVIFNEIPDYQKGSVCFFGETDEVGSLFRTGKIVSEILNEWNTSVAVFSLTGRGDALQSTIDNRSAVARLYMVNQRNPDPQVILRKARGMVNRKFVRVVVIEGLPINPETVEAWAGYFRAWKDTAMAVIGVVDDD